MWCQRPADFGLCWWHYWSAKSDWHWSYHLSGWLGCWRRHVRNFVFSTSGLCLLFIMYNYMLLFVRSKKFWIVRNSWYGICFSMRVFFYVCYYNFCGVFFQGPILVWKPVVINLFTYPADIWCNVDQCLCMLLQGRNGLFSACKGRESAFYWGVVLLGYPWYVRTPPATCFVRFLHINIITNIFCLFTT